jgi:hypothetical protein
MEGLCQLRYEIDESCVFNAIIIQRNLISLSSPLVKTQSQENRFLPRVGDTISMPRMLVLARTEHLLYVH